eukprot:COSAG01_NODE_5823_length_4011_cov_3.745399_2_plen_213_part_00
MAGRRVPFRVDRTQRRTYASELHKAAPQVIKQAEWCSRWSPSLEAAAPAAHVLPRPRSLSPLRASGLSMSRVRSTQAMLGHTTYLFGEVNALSSGLLTAADDEMAAEPVEKRRVSKYAPSRAHAGGARRGGVAPSPFTQEERRSRFNPGAQPTRLFETMRLGRRTKPVLSRGQLTLTKHRHLGAAAHVWRACVFCGLALCGRCSASCFKRVL